MEAVRIRQIWTLDNAMRGYDASFDLYVMRKRSVKPFSKASIPLPILRWGGTAVVALTVLSTPVRGSYLMAMPARLSMIGLFAALVYFWPATSEPPVAIVRAFNRWRARNMAKARLTNLTDEQRVSDVEFGPSGIHTTTNGAQTEQKWAEVRSFSEYHNGFAVETNRGFTWYDAVSFYSQDDANSVKSWARSEALMYRMCEPISTSTAKPDPIIRDEI